MRIQTRFSPLLTQLPVGLLLLVLLGATALFVIDGLQVIPFRYPMDYGEGPLLAQTLKLGRLEGIYRADLTVPPYTVSNYPPLYPLLLSPAARLWGPAFWYGRTLSWLSIAVAAALLGLIVEALTRDRLAATVAALLLLAFPPAAYWASLYRVDALALALSLAGLCVCARRPRAASTVPLALVLLTAAVFTRQSYGLAAPLAACSWLLHAAGWRRAMTLAASFIGLAGGLFLGLDRATGGGFAYNTIAANINDFVPSSLLGYFSDVWMLMPLTLVAAGLFAISAGWVAVPSWYLVAPYLVGALLSGLTIGKVGSNVNYLLELGAAVSLSIGALLAWQRPRRLVQGTLALLLALDVALMVLAAPYRTVAHARLAQAEAAERLFAIVDGANGLVLADEEMGLLPLASRPIHLQPFEMTQLARAGRWDQGPLLREIESQAFAVILVFRLPDVPLHRTRWTDEMLEAIGRRYVLEERVGQTDVYRPRPAR